jgi:hypothetical protein
MSRIGGRLTVRKRTQRNLQYFWSSPHGILSGMLLRNNTTLLEATMTNIRNGPHCDRKGTRKYQSSQTSSIPCAPRWVSNTPNEIWRPSIVSICIDTSKQKWSLCTSHHQARLIDMLSK